MTATATATATSTVTTTKPRSRAQARRLQRFGPWAVVTGASDGIGRELALRLAEAGFALVLVARRQAALAELAAALAAAHQTPTRIVAVDLAAAAGVAALLAATAELDVGLLVAAAGFGTSGAFVELSVDDELAMIDVNCRAVVALSHAFAQRLCTRGRGGLLLMSSLVGFQGVPRAATYAATKAFVQSFAEALRVELRPRGVDVLAVAPGPVHSGFAARAAMTMTLAHRPRDIAAATLAALGRRGTVRPGWLSKALEWALMLLPRWGRVRVMGVVMGRMARPPHAR